MPDSQISHLLEVMIADLREENTRQHMEIMDEVRLLDDDLDSIKLWRAKIIGIDAAISTAISAAAWAAGRLWG